MTLTHGRHQFSFGAWFQPFQSNETIALSQYGQATFTSLQTFLQGTASSFLYDPAPTAMNWRSLFGAWYAEDVIRLTPKLTLSLGFRDEFSTGWNEAHGRAANYTFTNGVISNAAAHRQIRFSPSTTQSFCPNRESGLRGVRSVQEAVLRAGFGMYNDLQDALGYRTDQNAPFNPTYSIAALPVSQLPIDPAAPVPAKALLVPGGVQPDMKTPTLISWSLRVQQELSPNTSLTVGYVGSHGYHEIIGVDANEPFPTICPASPCPATYPEHTSLARWRMPQFPPGTYYIPAGTPKANPTIANTWTWFSLGNSTYNALQVDLNHRFSHGLSSARRLHLVKGAGRWRLAERDDGGKRAGAGLESVQPARRLGPRQHTTSGTWRDQRRLRVAVRTRQSARERPGRLGQRAGQRLVGEQHRHRCKPDFHSRRSSATTRRTTATRAIPVRPFVNPDFTGSAILGNPNQWFNPNAFLRRRPTADSTATSDETR